MHNKDELPIEPFVVGYNYENPQISPNGRFLSFQQRSDHGTDLILFDISSGGYQTLLFQEIISTGTAYGGQTYCWSPDSESIVYSSKGQLKQIDISGGLARDLTSIDKSFHPAIDPQGLYFIVEHEDHMSLAYSNKLGDDFDWPQRYPVRYHFIYDPVRHPDGHFFIHAWDFPNMSWNGSMIVKISLDGSKEIIAGSDTVYANQPRLSPDNRHLTFYSEEKGWRNLWIADGDGSNPRILLEEQAEHTYTTWVSGHVNNVWIYPDQMIVTRLKEAEFSLIMVNTEGKVIELDIPHGYYTALSTDNNGLLSFIYSGPKTPLSVKLVRISKSGEMLSDITVVASGIITRSFEQRLVTPTHLTYPTRDGEEAHGLLYRPDRDKFKFPSGYPLLITVHGGPTGASTNKFNLDAQYFVNQGWYVFSSNYRGSIGYGKEYRSKLNGKWGDYDVDDAVDVISYLKDEEGINPDKVAIMGGSAGGFTTLMALIKYPGTFAAGINLFGVSDLFLLAEETHYLESHYLDILIGVLPDEAENYKSRSPLNFAEKIVDPILILQGKDDPVVPKNQSEYIFQKVKGIKEIKLYEGEGHGFRKIDTLKDMYPRINKFLKQYVLYK